MSDTPTTDAEQRAEVTVDEPEGTPTAIAPIIATARYRAVVSTLIAGD